MTGYAIPPRQWPAKPVYAPHPAPEVASRPAEAVEVPRGAFALQRAAERAGWRVLTTYARGTAADARGRPTEVVHSVAVRLRAPDLRLRAVACYVTPVRGGKPESDGCWIWSGFGMPRRVGVNELKQILTNPDIGIEILSGKHDAEIAP